MQKKVEILVELYENTYNHMILNARCALLGSADHVFLTLGFSLFFLLLS